MTEMSRRRVGSDSVPRMSVVQSVSSVEEEAAGPSYSVPRLCSSLADRGVDVQLLTLGTRGEGRRNGYLHSSFDRDPALLPMLSKLGRSKKLELAFGDKDGCVFHAHGLWMMPTVYSSKAAKTTNQPFVLSPRGMLGADALKFSRPAKQVFQAIWQQQALKRVSCFHATAESEYSDIRNFGLRHPVAIIPNGVDLHDRPARSNSFAHQPVGQRYALSLGRIHPKKGLDMLIDAWGPVASVHPDWRLLIVGPDEGGHAEVLSQKISGFGLSEQILIMPSVYGEEKFRIMAGASVFILPTQHENFGLTVAESLAQETPVIVTHGAPWEGVISHGCGWWVERKPEVLTETILSAIALGSAELARMGKRGRHWMSQEFAWAPIAEQMEQVYRWLIYGGVAPECVVED